MKNKFSNSERAQILVQALPYIKEYNNKVLVVKYGGNAMIDDKLKEEVMQDIVLLSLIGIKVVLVHGGGPEISETMNKLGKKSEFINGLRITDKETMDIVQMVLCGKVNKTLVNLLQSKGGKAMGISGMDGKLIEAKQKDKKLGFVGEITKINIDAVIDLLDNGYIPVISTIGCDEQGNAYNINGDTAAAYIAGALKAQNLILMTDIAGILKDINDPDSLIKQLTVSQAQKLYQDGIITEGMIPKVGCCIGAIGMGVEQVVIMDGTVEHSILMEILTDEGAGTLIIGDKKIDTKGHR